MILLYWFITHTRTVAELVLAFILGAIWAMYVYGIPANDGKKAK